MPSLILTNDQTNALHEFMQFLLSPVETVFILEGYSGTGKTTLVSHLLDIIPNTIRTAKLINPQFPDYDVELTATTNKAAENLSQISGMTVATIQSTLGLRVETDFKTNSTKLVPTRGHQMPYHKILFIDEASYIDSQLLDHIFTRTIKCKIVLIGDPAQLTPVKVDTAPAFKLNCPRASLREVVRNGGNILDLATAFRETVETGEFFSFTPDGQEIVYLAREDFAKEIVKEFTRPNWRYSDSKILAWTNRVVVEWNRYVGDILTGSPELKVGDYVLNNNYVTRNKISLKTDQLCLIKGIRPAQELGVIGHWYELSGVRTEFFMPVDKKETKRRLDQARKEDDWYAGTTISDSWADFRAIFACTINKAQGSTFDKVFIDLDDIRRCNSGNQIARMLYVAVSRARLQVVLTGDLV